MKEELEKTIRACVHDGRLLGLKESLEILNQFLDRKVYMGYQEFITRGELKTFLDTYINEVKEEKQ